MAKPGSETFFIIPDTHIPEHDEAAVACMLKAHTIVKPDYTLHLGDLMDCAMFSAHTKRNIPEALAYDFKEKEVDPTNAIWDKLQKNTKKHSYYLLGNHEERIERWAASQGQTALAVYNILSPLNTIAKGRKNFTMIPYSVPTGDRMGYVQIVPDRKDMITGGLVAVHGWSFAKNAAQVHLQKSRSQSIVYGHTHRTQLEGSRDPWTGKPVKAFSPGCLSKLQMLYMTGGSPSDWSHGFAIVYVGKNSWTEYVINIYNGYCVLPDGKEIKT